MTYNPPPFSNILITIVVVVVIFYYQGSNASFIIWTLPKAYKLKDPSHWLRALCPKLVYSSPLYSLYFKLRARVNFIMFTMLTLCLIGLHANLSWQTLGPNPELPHGDHLGLSRVWVFCLCGPSNELLNVVLTCHDMLFVQDNLPLDISPWAQLLYPCIIRNSTFGYTLNSLGFTCQLIFFINLYE